MNIDEEFIFQYDHEQKKKNGIFSTILIFSKFIPYFQ